MWKCTGRYHQAHHQQPEANADELGLVVNPFTGESLDVRGMLPGSRIWNPRTGRQDQIFGCRDPFKDRSGPSFRGFLSPTPGRNCPPLLSEFSEILALPTIWDPIH
jgi:hypothetical protein